MVDCKRRNSNFLSLIKEFIKELQTEETMSLLEQIEILLSS